MFCPNCGAKNDDDSVFCVHCGRKISIPYDNSSNAGQEDRDPYDHVSNTGQEYRGPYDNVSNTRYEDTDPYDETYDTGYASFQRRQMPPKKNHTLRIGIIIAAVIAGAGVAAFFGIRAFRGNTENSPSAAVSEVQTQQNGTGENSPTTPAQTPPETNASTPTVTPIATVSPIPTDVPAVTPAVTSEPAPTVTPTSEPTPTLIPTSEPTPTLKPTSEPTPQPVPTLKPTAAPSYGGTTLYVQKPDSGLNIHVDSDFNSADLFTVYGTTPMVFNGVVEPGYGSDGAIHDWYQVSVSNVRGWVRSDLVQSTGDGYYIKNVEGAMNMRTDHRYSSDIAGTLCGNTKLRFTGQTGTGYGSDGQMHNWMLVETAQTITGWVRGDLTIG